MDIVPPFDVQCSRVGEVQLNIMTRSSTIAPGCAADRYDAESCPSDDFVNVFGGESDDADHTCDAWTTSDGASSQQRPSIHGAAKKLLEHLSDGNEEFLDVDGVAKFLRIPRTAAHCIVDVLDVFQVIIPRGSMYTWRGTTHVALLLQSDKFKTGASMQCGIAVPKVCRAMIPHLRDNVGVEFTVKTMAKWLWEAQGAHDVIPTIAEAHAQQLRALCRLVADILAVIQALGYIDFAVCPKRGDIYLYNPHSQTQLISPKGMQQSARMRNMRVLFDGPAPTPTLRPGTAASHRSIPKSAGGSSRPYTAATIGAIPQRGRTRPQYTPPHPPRDASTEESSHLSVPSARSGRTPPPPRAYARAVAAGRPRQPRGIYASRARTPPIAPHPQPAPPTMAPSTERRGGRTAAAHADSDEDVRSAVYPTMSEWCSMQQELVDRGGGLDGAGAEDDVFSDSHSEVMPLVCEDVRRGSLGAPRGYSVGARRLRDQSCGGRVEGALPPGVRGPDRTGRGSGLPPSARPVTGGSGYYRGRGSSGLLAGKVGGLEPRSSSVEPRVGMAAVRDVDVRAPGGVAKLKHMFETTRMSRIGGFGGSTKVHHMVQRYEGGSSPEQ